MQKAESLYNKMEKSKTMLHKKKTQKKKMNLDKKPGEIFEYDSFDIDFKHTKYI